MARPYRLFDLPPGAGDRPLKLGRPLGSLGTMANGGSYQRQTPIPFTYELIHRRVEAMRHRARTQNPAHPFCGCCTTRDLRDLYDFADVLGCTVMPATLFRKGGQCCIENLWMVPHESVRRFLRWRANKNGYNATSRRYRAYYMMQFREPRRDGQPFKTRERAE
jgi:hypothetical protein